MKLSKFELLKMPVSEMNAIKAGSGSCSSGLLTTNSSTGEEDSMSSDKDQD